MPPQTLDDLRHSDSTNNSKTPANTMVSDDGSVALLVGLLLREWLLSDGMAVALIIQAHHAAYAHITTYHARIFMVDAELSWIGCACQQARERAQASSLCQNSGRRSAEARTVTSSPRHQSGDGQSAQLKSYTWWQLYFAPHFFFPPSSALAEREMKRKK